MVDLISVSRYKRMFEESPIGIAKVIRPKIVTTA